MIDETKCTIEFSSRVNVGRPAISHTEVWARCRCGLPIWEFGSLKQVTFLCSVLLVSLLIENRSASGSEDREAFFEAKIRPVLVEVCLRCHGESKASAGLKVDSSQALVLGGESGAAIVPGKPEDSLLIRAVARHDNVSAMPPEKEKALRPDQVNDFSMWIKNGAFWPEKTAPFRTTQHWAFQPIGSVKRPDVGDVAWVNNNVDCFIRAKQEAMGLSPAPKTDRRALIRRVTFDLTGLQPSPDEVKEFVQDDSPAAYEKVVDRLLSAPSYGQRWGRHWLDVVRYADARDLIQLPAESDFREAWRYRDWVVDAFNRDLPYNEFVTRQLAGDLCQPANPNEIDPDSLVATGLLAIADFVPGDVDKQQMIADYVNDEIDVVGRAFLGMTLACARCHDHKFDPITIEDYYSLAGIFFSTRVIPSPVPGNTPLVRVALLPPSEVKEIQRQSQLDKQQIAELSYKIQSAVDQQFVFQLESRIAKQAAHDLHAAVEYLNSQNEVPPPTLADFAKERNGDATTLEKCVKLLNQQPDVKALLPRLNEAEDVEKSLATLASRRRDQETPCALLHFRADDRHIAVDKAGQVTLWPDRAALAEDAKPLSSLRGPKLATNGTLGDVVPVLRFDGEAVLQTERVVPATGSLFIVFRIASDVPKGARIIGWEDSAVGQHGIGLMLDPEGGFHAILRNKGANGDVVAPPQKCNESQLLSLTWDSRGVALYRNGELLGKNQSIEAVSSDPAISALRLGEASSGGGPRFRGDLFELRVYGGMIDETARLRIEQELRNRWLNVGASSSGSRELTPFEDLYNEMLSPRSPYWVESADRQNSLAAEVRTEIDALREELEGLKKKPAIFIPQAVVVQDGGPSGTKHEGFQDAEVYLRGNPATPGKKVPRGVPHVLAGSEPLQIASGSGRRELARWLTSPSHPLPARVMVNRLWQHHFGEGLVRTSTNFGFRGERPSHPELLDHLANRFIESGWSIKAIQRDILLSNAYQQSSQVSEAQRAVDPENRWLTWMPRRRLESEAIRDSLLAVSGQLDSSAGGPAFLDAKLPRRTLYLMSTRTGTKTAEFHTLFDGPDGGGIIERRNQSIVASQALFLLNDSFLDNVSIALANRVSREVPTGSLEDWIMRLYELTLGRPPTVDEIEIGRQLCTATDDSPAIVGDADDRDADAHNAKVADVWARYCRVILCTNEFIYVD